MLGIDSACSRWGDLTKFLERKEMDNTQKLSEFGKVMGCAFTILSGIAIWKGSFLTAFWLLVLASAFIALAIIFPVLLGPVERLWMAFAEKLGSVVTFLILSLSYFLVITPLGLLYRVFSKNPLQMKIEQTTPSYWLPSDHTGSGSRYYTPY